MNYLSLILFLKEQKLIKGRWIFLNNKSEVLQRLSLSLRFEIFQLPIAESKQFS